MKAISLTFAVVVLVAGIYAAYVIGPIRALASYGGPPAPIFEVGQTYAVLWSCLNQIGCYGETFQVQEIRPNGWLRVITQSQEEWWLNPDQMLSVQSYQQHVTPARPVTGPVMQVLR
jgi:hypothetical protein